MKLVEALELFSHLANIGDTHSLVIHPASTTHRQLSDEQKIAAGAGPDVVRLSVGIEDVEDIIADLEQALGEVSRGSDDCKFSHLRHRRRRTRARRPGAGRIISGDPHFRTWNVEEAEGGLYAGIWEATPGKWRIDYDEWEFCHILSGVSVIAEEGGEPRLRAGDSIVLRPGFKGTWEVVETTRKDYVIKL